MKESFIKCLSEAGETRKASRLKTMLDNRSKWFAENSRVTEISSIHLSPENRLAQAIKLYKTYSKERPYGIEASEALRRIVDLSNQLKQFDLICTYTLLLLDVLSRRDALQVREFRKYRERVVDAYLALGKIDSAKDWVDVIESNTDTDPTLENLISSANLEVKVKRTKNAEKYLDYAEAEILDNRAAVPFMRQIESTWILMGSTDRAENIQRRISNIKVIP